MLSGKGFVVLCIAHKRQCCHMYPHRTKHTQPCPRFTHSSTRISCSIMFFRWKNSLWAELGRTLPFAFETTKKHWCLPFACFREKALIGKPAKITFVEKKAAVWKGALSLYDVGTQHTQPSPRFIHCENSSSCLRFRAARVGHWRIWGVACSTTEENTDKYICISLCRPTWINQLGRKQGCCLEEEWKFVWILLVLIRRRRSVVGRFWTCLFPREGFSRQTCLSHLRPKKDAGNGNDLVFAQPTNGSVATCWHIELCRHVALQEWPGQRKALVKPQQKPGEPG